MTVFGEALPGVAGVTVGRTAGSGKAVGADGPGADADVRMAGGLGPISRDLAERLRTVESKNVTYVDETGPIFWTEALGANVRDADGNVYLDLTGAFGVALHGHAHPHVVRALREQSGRLVHGMGDVQPPAIKVDFLERLSAALPWPDSRSVMASTGSEAMEIALKTARLATDSPGVLAFEGSYHGLTLGALAMTHRTHFRGPFESTLHRGVRFVPFPDGPPEAGGGGGGNRGRDATGEGGTDLDNGAEASAARGREQVAETSGLGLDRAAEALERIAEALERGAPNGDRIGAVVVEPIQGRAGVRIPPGGFMQQLSELAHDRGALVVADEILTGSGRCGAMLASTLVGLEPDIVALGKALGGGVPLSVCAGRASVMDAWPESEGEAVHTSTFLGHPLACAAGLAVLSLLDGGEDGMVGAVVGAVVAGGPVADGDVTDRDAMSRVQRLGPRLLTRLRGGLAGTPGVREVRGLGLLLGIDLVGADDRPAEGAAVRVAERALADGVIVLPAGAHGHVVELMPPVVLTAEQEDYAVESVIRAVREVGW